MPPNPLGGPLSGLGWWVTPLVLNPLLTVSVCVGGVSSKSGRHCEILKGLRHLLGQWWMSCCSVKTFYEMCFPCPLVSEQWASSRSRNQQVFSHIVFTVLLRFQMKTILFISYKVQALWKIFPTTMIRRFYSFDNDLGKLCHHWCLSVGC